MVNDLLEFMINGGIMEEKNWSEKHPRLNLVLGFIMLIVVILVGIWIVETIFEVLGNGIKYIKSFLSTTDTVLVVAMFTGMVSITGVVISSIVAKVVEYRYNVKKYLYDRREEPYKKFIELIYTMMEDTKKREEDRMSQEQQIAMISELSRGLTLWGSNRVVKKWLIYRKHSLENPGIDSLWELEDMIYEIRKDVGLGRRLGKGDMLAFFINDIDKLKSK